MSVTGASVDSAVDASVRAFDLRRSSDHPSPVRIRQLEGPALRGVETGPGFEPRAQGSLQSRRGLRVRDSHRLQVVALGLQ